MGVKIREKVQGSGEWWVYIYQNGQQISRKIGDKRLAKQVAYKLELQLAEGKLGIVADITCPTFKNYAEIWLETQAKLSFKKSTYNGYRLIISRYLIPEFGTKRLSEITPQDVSRFVYSMFSAHRSKTVRNAKNCLSGILQHAASEDGHITSNPARGVKVPTPESETPSRIPDPFTFSERTHFETVAQKKSPHLIYPLTVIGFRTGLRAGELLALQIGDIDFFNGLIHVQHNISRGKVSTPKSKSSKRMVRMTPDVTAIMRKQILRSKELRLKNGWENMDWIFPTPDGTHYTYSGIIKAWNRVMESAGMKRRTPHDLRHTYATLRLSLGHPLAEVSKEMGHSTTRLTYETYYKWLPSESTSDISDLDQKPPETCPIPSQTKRAE